MLNKYNFTNKFKDKNIIKGLNLEVIKKISKLKNEPKWMLDIRIQAYKSFLKIKNPNWGPKLDFINFNDYYYYIEHDIKEEKDWNNVPKEIKDTFKKLDIPELEAKTLSGIHGQIDQQSIYNEIANEIKKDGAIFCSFDEAILKYPDLVKKYFTKIVSYADNKYAALNTAVWSGGSFIYVPKNVKIEKPLQAYFRINSKYVGQFERTLIILEDNSDIHYMEGCTAPVYLSSNLHAAVVEIYVGKNAKCQYTTIQNWSKNVLNLVTKRAMVDDNGYMYWLDGNIGSGLNMKYPCCILKGNNAVARCISISTSSKDMIQDTGAKMIHIGKNTRSSIISKSIASNGGTSNFRGYINIKKDAINSYADVNCDTMILDDLSSSDTIPTEKVENNSSFIKHEAKITNFDKELLYYLNIRKIPENKAKQLLIIGFFDDFTKQLPLEYAVEFNRLIKQIF